jgi:hypothetical protein
MDLPGIRKKSFSVFILFIFVYAAQWSWVLHDEIMLISTKSDNVNRDAFFMRDLYKNVDIYKNILFLDVYKGFSDYFLNSL